MWPSYMRGSILNFWGLWIINLEKFGCRGLPRKLLSPDVIALGTSRIADDDEVIQ